MKSGVNGYQDIRWDYVDVPHVDHGTKQGKAAPTRPHSNCSDYVPTLGLYRIKNPSGDVTQ